MYITVTDTPSTLANQSLDQACVVVLDIFRATSTMVTAMYHGINTIHPVPSVEEALAFKSNHPHALLGGEQGGEIIAGFNFGNSPLEYKPELLKNKTLIFLTTNGTKAVLAAKGASTIYLGSFLNASVTASKILGEPKLILACAGTNGEYSLEDSCGAGYLIHLLQDMTEVKLSDSARASLMVYQTCQHDLPKLLQQSVNGQVLYQKGRQAEIEYCCTKDIIPLILKFSPQEGIMSFPYEERRLINDQRNYHSSRQRQK